MVKVLFRLAHHEVHSCSDICIRKRGIATFGRHGAFAFECSCVEGGGPGFKARCLGGLVFKLGGTGGAAGVASNAASLVNILAAGGIGLGGN